jgi:phosphoribosylformylglycinamidine synthase II
MEPYTWQNMGLKDEEYSKIKKLLGREPNFTELGIFAVMWSEHCSYKTSKPVLKKFPTSGKQVIQGPGENAGVIDIGEKQAVVFKIESHNHPSAIEPFHGAATGVGGIVRDIFTMGARPIALLNSLRFGELNNDKTKYLFSKVVSGIAWYGNSLGVPTVGGEVFFDKSYEGNPLVNAMCVGLVDKEKLAKGVATGIGNPVMVVGASTGRDGIHGATFASADLIEDNEENTPTAQVGDPFMEKLLLEACLEIIDEDLVVGMQDMGAAGLTSSSSEMAARAGTGIEIDVSLVPTREEGMNAYEIMLSESQERMLLVPKRGSEDRIQEIFNKWGLNAVKVGVVIEEPVLRIKDKDKIEAEIPVKALVGESPVYQYPLVKPDESERLKLDLDEIPVPEDFNETLRKLLSSPTIASKKWVYDQYDHGDSNTVVNPGSDAAVIRIKGTEKGIALTTDCNGRYCYLDPYQGGIIAVAEAARNVACAGAVPLAITNCLNFGNPEKPEVYWQLNKCIEGMASACKYLDTPVTGGNVSLYNESSVAAVHPTPVVGMVGLLENIEDRLTQGFKKVGSKVILLGETKGHLGGSEYLYSLHGITAGEPPEIDLKSEKNLQQLVVEAAQKRILLSAHDCSEGGLAVALAESAISGELGIDVTLPEFVGRLDALLFGEDQSRIVVSTEDDKLNELFVLCEKYTIPYTVLGEVTTDDKFIISYAGKGEIINLSLEEISKVWVEAIPCQMG